MENMYEFAKELFPICRSIAGPGTKKTLELLRDRINQIDGHKSKIFNVESGKQVFDWTIPNEWHIKSAKLIDPNGKIVVDFNNHNLHIMSHSVPIDTKISYDDLQDHLYSLPDQLDAIPYVTSYYEDNWGFCMKHSDRLKLKKGIYHAKIDSELKQGHLSYLELLIPGQLDEEIFFSTYVCHPSMANNELSGPVVVSELCKWLKQRKNRYSYRIVFIPETIGSITYIHKNLDDLKFKTYAGVNVTCVGDEGPFSLIHSRKENTISDRMMKNILSQHGQNFKEYSYQLGRGSDERQYCSPGVDLPIVTFTRSRFGTYPQYHTSLDDMTFISQKGLEDSLEVLKLFVECIENNRYFYVRDPCEPNLGKRGLYPTVSTKRTREQVKDIKNVLAHMNYWRDPTTKDKNDLLDISEKTKISIQKVILISEQLHNLGLILM